VAEFTALVDELLTAPPLEVDAIAAALAATPAALWPTVDARLRADRERRARPTTRRCWR
jgi:hypothetical protein